MAFTEPNRVLFNKTHRITSKKATKTKKDTNARRIGIPIFTYYHSFRFFGRSANVNASLPYAVGNFFGTVLGTERSIYRSGLADFSFRLAVNLKGGPAMEAMEFAKWKQKLTEPGKPERRNLKTAADSIIGTAG